MNWPEYQLVRLTQRFISGGTPDTKTEDYWNGEIPWITGADFADGEIILGRRYITQNAVEHSATNVVPADSVLMVTRTGVGKLAIAPVDVAISQDITGIVPVPGIGAKFVIAALRNKMSTLLAAQRGATIKGVIRKDVENLMIPLPAPSEQRRIVEILDQADALRKKRAEADIKADRILPTLFYNMFGDPSANSKHWSIEPLSRFFTHDRHGPRCGPFGSALKRHEYVERGIPVWGIDNVQANRFCEDGSLFITEDKYQELTAYSVEAGDILISRAGTVGRMCVAKPSVVHSIIGTNLIRLAFDIKALHPEYLSGLFTYFPGIVSRLRAASEQGAYSFLNTSVLRLLEIPVPPMELQHAFANFGSTIQRIEQSQMAARTQIKRLYKTTLERAFTGALTANWRESRVTELLAEMEVQAKELHLTAEP
jgi:type I restriction enzyme S subunit